MKKVIYILGLITFMAASNQSSACDDKDFCPDCNYNGGKCAKGYSCHDQNWCKEN